MKLLNRQDLRSIGIRWSRQHLDRLIKASEFPQPVKIGQNTRVWIESEIDHWIEQRAAARERETAAKSEAAAQAGLMPRTSANPAAGDGGARQINRSGKNRPAESSRPSEQTQARSARPWGGAA